MIDVETAYRRYFPMIREKCRRMLDAPEVAAEIAQETFARLWKNRLNAMDERQVSAWVYRTATHIAIDHLRRQRRHMAVTVGEAQWPSDEVSEPERRCIGRQAIADLAGRLSRDELQLLILRYADGLTIDEIAEVLDTSERSTRRALSALDGRLQRIRRET